MDAESASSVLVSRTLNDIGYNQEMVKLRQQCWGNLGGLPRYIVAGSKAEGLTQLTESDIDYLDSNNDILCTSRNPMLYNNAESLTVLQMDRTNTAPGYTTLVCVKAGTHIDPNLIASFTPVAGNMYLSSDSWREHAAAAAAEAAAAAHYSCILRQHPAQGPSNPCSIILSHDSVQAIICDCPEILQSWIHRPRRHGWPPAEVIEEISTLEAHVVPVGFKQSSCQFLEWRICFTRAEIKLIQSFNDSQVKLIILLKMIAKSSLKHVCKEMTTYVMKNIVLWLAELYPSEFFTEQNLLLSLKIALKFLSQCLSGKFLPSYMIPERNLLVNTLAPENRSELSDSTKLCATIDILLNEGPRMLLRCDKIKNAWNLMYSDPEMFCSLNKVSKQFEMEALLSLNRVIMEIGQFTHKQRRDHILALEKNLVTKLSLIQEIMNVYLGEEDRNKLLVFLNQFSDQMS